MSKFFYIKHYIGFSISMVLYFYFFLEKEVNLSRFFLAAAIIQAGLAYYFYKRHKAKLKANQK